MRASAGERAVGASLTRDAVRLGGEAPQTAPLLKIFDGSPLFQNTETLMSVRSGTGEAFQIRTTREKGQ